MTQISLESEQEPLDEGTRQKITEQIKRAKEASFKMSVLAESSKNYALELIERELLESINYIVEANQKDLENARKTEIPKAMLDRLVLNPERLMGMAKGIRTITGMKDPVGNVLGGWVHPKGMQIIKITVPLGVIGIIYEARPNVTTDAVALCIKSGNSCVLRGSKQAYHTNLAIMDVVYRAIQQTQIPLDAIQYLQSKSRESARLMLKAEKMIDLVIPRGCELLNKFVTDNSLIPVLGAGGGVCHIFVDKHANFDRALDIIINAKTQRPTVCNACETILVHGEIKDNFLPGMIQALINYGVQIVGDKEVQNIFPLARLATDKDWSTEYLDLIVSVKIVKDIKEAIEHINHYSTGHSEAIITESLESSEIFKRSINSACVYINVSTRFTDGEEFGFGAEMGISTQKLHARGPIGLKELCSYKYIIEGSGQIRN